MTITGALSTTQAQTATASGTYYKARVAWNNNGASASAKLRIAVNADNAVHGLVVGQSVKRRDYEMTMGDGVILTWRPHHQPDIQRRRAPSQGYASTP